MPSDEWNRAAVRTEAPRLQEQIRSRGDYAHVTVRAHGVHLLVERHDGNEAHVVARATSLGGGQYGLSFRRHTGRWEPMPVSGSLDEVATDLVDLLAPYLARADFPVGISGTGH